jgi:hypothetical protein
MKAASGLMFEENVVIVLRGPDGKIKDVRKINNTVTTAGKAGIMDQVLAAPTLAKAAWIAIGTSTPAATLLGAEVARVAMSPATGRAAAVVTYQAPFPAGTGTGAITEAGTFDVVTANTVNMWMSTSFAVINKLVGDSLTFSWTLTGA